jgi:hypothetical protein
MDSIHRMSLLQWKMRGWKWQCLFDPFSLYLMGSSTPRVNNAKEYLTPMPNAKWRKPNQRTNDKKRNPKKQKSKMLSGVPHEHAKSRVKSPSFLMDFLWKTPRGSIALLDLRWRFALASCFVFRFFVLV